MSAHVFVYGDRVVVTAGLSAGVEGIVDQLTRVSFGPIPCYAVKLPEGLRVLRADYLRKVAA